MRNGENIICPSCGGSECIPGKLDASDPDGFAVGKFYPLNIKYFVYHPSVLIENGSTFKACLDCGHLWSEVNHKELRSLLLNRGRAEETLTKADTPKRVNLLGVLLAIGLLAIVLIIINMQSQYI